ncbi:MAG: molecular chaperone TorD, partial [Nitrospiraceae bacterium]
MQLTDEFIRNEGHRADCYRFLSACYSYSIQDLKDEGLKNLIASLQPVCGEAVSFARDMDEALASAEVLSLKVDHSALFIGPFKLISPPYGSAYLEEGRAVMGGTTVDAIKFYKSAGVEMDPQQKDIPDHIAVELE